MNKPGLKLRCISLLTTLTTATTTNAEPQIALPQIRVGYGNGWETGWEVQAIFPTLSHHYQSPSLPHPTSNMLTSPTWTSPKGLQVCSDFVTFKQTKLGVTTDIPKDSAGIHAVARHETIEFKGWM